VDPIAAKERYESSNQANTVCEICDERWSAADPYRAYNVLDEMIRCLRVLLHGQAYQMPRHDSGARRRLLL